MAEYEVAAGKVGAHSKTLVANTVDTVTFADPVTEIEVFSDGAEKLYFTVDGSEPTIAGDDCFEMPPVMSVRGVHIRSNPAATSRVVKLISAGTPEYSVAKASD